jgi:uncharacterized protein DUF4265
MTGEFDRTNVKILVHTKTEDGYPPEEWESLWATPVGGGRFKIDNIPFYAKNLSCGDIIEASPEGEAYVFRRVIRPSENSTIRVVIHDLADESGVRNDLTSLGCSIEGTGTPGLIAVNVPKTSIENVLDVLENAFADEKLDFEEGALR